MTYWATFPPAHEVGRTELMATTTWKPPHRDGTGDSSTPEEVRGFASGAGIPVGNLDHMPPHLRACLESARAQMASGKVN